MDSLLTILSWQAWLTIGVLVVMVIALAKDLARTDYVLLGSLGVLLLAGVVTPEEAFKGFSNQAVLTIAALFVVAEAVHRTNALALLERIFFVRSSRPSVAVPVMMLGVAGLSAFLNNTPVVSMLIPRVQAWSTRVGIPASKLLIPLSYAAIIGGITTLIGTSTNIVVSGMLEQAGLEPLGMFDLTWIGLPAALAVILFFALGGHRLMPVGKDEEDHGTEEARDYLFEFKVPADSPFVGKTVQEAGLRHLGTAYLVHRISGGHVRSVDPGVVLTAGDVLAFAGEFKAASELLEEYGLEPVVERFPESKTSKLPLFEAVVAPSSGLVGKTLKETGFRESYGGVVLAIRRGQQRIRQSLGETVIETGDLLLVEAPPAFFRRWMADRDEFYVVHQKSNREDRAQTGRAPLVLLIVIGMVVVSTLKIIPLVTAAFSAALAMIVFRCIRGREAQKAVDTKVIVVIAAALGIGKAVETTGLSTLMSTGLVELLLPMGTIAVMIGLYATTNVLTELITHKAAAVLMVPVALATAERLGVPPTALVIVVAIGAAASFMTPIGYQTNLMVMSAGGYRFKDYLRAGVPVSLLVMAVTVTMVWLVWLR
ncbi:MAG: SLC13 family permease [Rhodothermales bacterium]